MSNPPSAIEIIATASKLFRDICDIPVLSPLKPLGNIAVTICEHAAAVNENKEAAILLAKRVNSIVHILINRARDFDGAMPGNYMDDIRNLESVSVKIATELGKMGLKRNPVLRWLLPKREASQLSDLTFELDKAMQLFEFSAAIEARQTFQIIRPLASRELSRPAPSDVQCPTIDLSILRTLKELYFTANYSVQTGTYQGQVVVVKKYFKSKEEVFAQDLRQVLDQTHPSIACLIGSAYGARIMLLCAEDLIFCEKDVDDFGSIRGPWQEQKIGESISSTDLVTLGTSTSTLSQSSITPSHLLQVPFTSLSFLTIKESAALLDQLDGVVQFLKMNGVKVAWWQFKPSWVGVQRGNRKMVLFDWAQDIGPKVEVEFDPKYAIHLMGLSFSPLIPDAFQDSIRKGPGFSSSLKKDRDRRKQRLPDRGTDDASDEPSTLRTDRSGVPMYWVTFHETCRTRWIDFSQTEVPVDGGWVASITVFGETYTGQMSPTKSAAKSSAARVLMYQRGWLRG